MTNLVLNHLIWKWIDASLKESLEVLLHTLFMIKKFLKFLFSVRSRSKKSSFVSVPIPEPETSKEFSEASILATDEAAVISLLANQLNSHINHGQVQQHQQQQQQQFSRISNNISSHG